MKYELYYDKPTRTWYGFWTDKEGNQLLDAVFDHNREWCLIYLGMQHSDALKNLNKDK